MSAPDLSLVSTDDLVGALKARCDHLIFAAACERTHGEISEHRTAFKGHVLFCAGMAMDLVRDMQEWARKPAEDDDDPDDEEQGGT